MKDLRELGFGPPDLGLPKGNCENGHLWADNLFINRHGNRECGECKRSNRRVFANKNRANRRYKG